MKTFMANAQTVERKWYVVDADGMTLGRLASQVAAILRGKNKPTYTPHCDTGDHVIVINAAKVVLTGKKLDQKVYYHHSGYAGGLKETKYRKLMAEKPEFAVKHAIIGMMPKGPLGRQMARKLRVYAGAEHEHEAQKPEVLELVKYEQEGEFVTWHRFSIRRLAAAKRPLLVFASFRATARWSSMAAISTTTSVWRP